MGFFDFLKKPADKKEPTEQLEIFLNELEPFLDNQKKKEESLIRPQVEHHKSEISQLLKKLEENLEVLSKAEPKNKEIPDRVKHILEGNKQIYFQKINSLIEQTEVPADLDNIPAFTEKFDTFMTDFDRSIAKSHEVISQFFPKEAGAVSSTIRDMDKKVKDLHKEMKNSTLSRIETLKAISREAQNSIISKENLESEIKNLLNTVRVLSEENLKRNNDLDRLKQSAEYSQALNKIEEKQALEKELKKHESQIVHSFSEVESALRKYENMSENPIAKKYLENPVETLFVEKELGIVHILDSIKTAIDSGELILKDKKRDKVRKELSAMNLSYFQSSLSAHQKTSESISKVNHELENMPVFRNIENIQGETRVTEERIAEINSEIAYKQRSLAETASSHTLKDLEDEIKTVLNKEVKIKS